MVKLHNYFDIKWLVLAFFSTTIVIVLTHIPQESMPSQIQQSGLDKFLHALAYGTITLCINQIIGLQNKIKETKSKVEVEQDKARELLGGKTEWGGPILFGTVKQKLEQLKGYEGERIEEIREKLKKSLRKEKKKK